MAWGGVELDLTLSALAGKVRQHCGHPATVAVRRLDEQGRRVRCEGLPMMPICPSRQRLVAEAENRSER